MTTCSFNTVNDLGWRELIIIKLVVAAFTAMFASGMNETGRGRDGCTSKADLLCIVNDSSCRGNFFSSPCSILTSTAITCTLRSLATRLVKYKEWSTEKKKGRKKRKQLFCPYLYHPDLLSHTRCLSAPKQPLPPHLLGITSLAKMSKPVSLSCTRA